MILDNIFILKLNLSLFFFFVIKLYNIIKKNYFNQTEDTKLSHENTYNPKVYSFNELLNSNIKNKTILIFEPDNCHHECTPGYTKYFLDLGYNVDILFDSTGIKTFYFFPNIENIRLFIFEDLKQIEMNYKNLSSIIKKYDFFLLETTDKNKKKLNIKLGLLNINNSIFVFHYMTFIDADYSKYLNKNRVWTLGNVSKGLQVNPHYFGNTKIRDKNDKVKFFLTSTFKRNYEYLINAVEKLRNENLNFEIIITGRTRAFNSEKIPKNIKDYFIFKLNIPYDEMYKEVEKSDYIIITLDPKNSYDHQYKRIRVTGSMQLSLGFLKPVLINEEFAGFYSLNNENNFSIKKFSQ